MQPAEFEQWVYAQTDLEERMGQELYLNVLSVDYADGRAVFDIRQDLKAYAGRASTLRCSCITLPDLADAGMGDESTTAVFETLEKRAERGDPFWWLSLYACSACGQWWLVAQEERQNDVFFLRRLSREEGEKILEEHGWPTEFDSYAYLLRLGMERGHSVRFVDPLDSSLSWTAADLARERPGIHVSEMAQLLNLDLSLAEEIAKKAIREEGVEICMEPKRK